jgi:hypothetical protein
VATTNLDFQILPLLAGNPVLVAVPRRIGCVQCVVKDGHLSKWFEFTGNHVSSHIGPCYAARVDLVECSAVGEDDNRESALR